MIEQEEEIVSSPFLEGWHVAMLVAAIGLIIVGIALYVIHKLRVAAIRNYKDKYDFINTREIKQYKLVFICFGLAAACAFNLYGMGKVNVMGLWFFIRLFISVAAGTLVVYVAYLVLEYYYPTILNRKLKKYRYTPRVSKAGNQMRLLGEEEEDVHLGEGMKAEESAFSMDYDVWIDEGSGEVLVEKYPGHLQALQCGSCGFYTMKVVREEITRQPNPTTPGELIKHYQCSYCKAVRATAFNISTKEADDYKGTPARQFKKTSSNVDLVRVEIHSAVAGKKFYEFQNVDQAVKFLEGYRLEK
jgi:hypothetical protein